ncbi:MAG: hypothetical protein JXA03_03605 [Bacteroidales bacterium]|nr:hypothetical protein [Bacteroidales bacterium]
MAKNESRLYPSKVTGLEEISPGVCLLSFDKRFDFRPGQLLGLSVLENETQRLYSIASGGHDRDFQILFDVMHHGHLTPRLAVLKKGDTVFVSGPFGRFFGTLEPAYWVATGTGIAPFVSMFQSGLARNKILLHGGRTRSSFYFQDDFLPAFSGNYIRCCSGEDFEEYFCGRVTDFLLQQNELPLTHLYYLCGRAEMVVEARDILISKGIHFDRILSEIYF